MVIIDLPTNRDGHRARLPGAQLPEALPSGGAIISLSFDRCKFPGAQLEEERSCAMKIGAGSRMMRWSGF